ncbi:MAG: hypothetical protein ACLP1X_28980 [Polyangiaceae bacterium]|jgi:hypothetical protein
MALQVGDKVKWRGVDGRVQRGTIVSIVQSLTGKQANVQTPEGIMPMPLRQVRPDESGPSIGS